MTIGTEPMEDKNREDKKEMMRLWRMLRMVSGIGAGVVLITCLFFGAALLLNRYWPVGNTGVMVAVTLGGFAGLYWAYRRVSRILEELYASASRPLPPENRESDAQKKA